MSQTNPYKNLLVLTLCCFCFSIYGQNKQKQHRIPGTIQLDSTWNSNIYLSLIPSFNKMYTMSNSMIVSMTEIDNEGRFEFDTSFLPNDERLYRLHISKKNAPPASLIIGGNDENHIFFIAKKNSAISIQKRDSQIPFHQTKILGYQSNLDLKSIDDISRYIDSTNIEETYLKREFITKGINEKLRFIADSSSNALVSLYAIYKSKYDSNYSINKQFYTDYLEKWSANSSTYFEEFRNSLPVSKTKEKSYTEFVIGLTCFLFGIILSYYIFIIRKSNKLKSLSIQERKIYTLLVDGKSNKEISDEFNIGISTVKSHVSSIYNKLSVKSRKDLVNLNDSN